MSRKVQSAALGLCCYASSVGVALAAGNPFGPQSTWILADSVMDHNGDGVAEIVELHIDQVGNQFLSRRYASNGGVQSWLERDDAVFKFSDINPNFYENFVSSLRPGEFTFPSQYTPYGEPVYGKDDLTVTLDKDLINEMLFTFENESKYNSCKKHTVKSQQPKFAGVSMTVAYVDAATGNTTYDVSIRGEEGTISYTESRTGQPIELGGLFVISYKPSVDGSVFVPHSSCLEPVVLDAGKHRLELQSQPSAYRVLEPLSAKELAHEAWIQSTLNGSEQSAVAQLQFAAQNEYGQQWQEGGVGNRVKGTVWAGLSNEFSADKHYNNHDGYSNHCHGAPLYYTANDQANHVWYKWDSVNVPEGRSVYNQFGVVNYDDVYPHPDFGVCTENSPQNTPSATLGACLPENLRHYAINSMSDAEWVTAIALPAGPNRLVGQELSWCRAVPYWYRYDQTDDTPYKTWNHGLQATVSWDGDYADTTMMDLTSDDVATRQHDFCPVGMWSPVKTCSCDGTLYKRAVRGAVKTLFAANSPKKCMKLRLKCQKRNLIGICKQWSWEWDNEWLAKYHANGDTDWKVYSAAGRYDEPVVVTRESDGWKWLDTKICTALRLKGETFEHASFYPGIGDGFCEEVFNNDTFGYDGGDCCATTCVPQGPAPFDCSNLNCKQPGCVMDRKDPKPSTSIRPKDATSPYIAPYGVNEKEAPEVTFPRFCKPQPAWSHDAKGNITWNWSSSNTSDQTTCPPGFVCKVPGNVCVPKNQF